MVRAGATRSGLYTSGLRLDRCGLGTREDTNRTEDGDGLGDVIAGYGEAREDEKP